MYTPTLKKKWKGDSLPLQLLAESVNVIIPNKNIGCKTFSVSDFSPHGGEYSFSSHLVI